MNQEQFEDKHYHLSVTAGMNQRYHQRVNCWWTLANRSVQIIVAVLAVIGLCLSVGAYLVENKDLDWWAVAVAGAAAVAAIALNVLPFGDFAALHGDFLRRWSDLRQDIDALYFELHGEMTLELRDRLKQLDAKVHRICGSEPSPIKWLIHKCYADEIASRHKPHTSSPATAAA